MYITYIMYKWILVHVVRAANEDVHIAELNAYGRRLRQPHL